MDTWGERFTTIGTWEFGRLIGESGRVYWLSEQDTNEIETKTFKSITFNTTLLLPVVRDHASPPPHSDRHITNMEAELENYQFQLSQVSIALEADPTNTELTALKVELEEIIALTKEALGVSQESQAKNQASTSTGSVSNQPSKGKAKESAATNSKNFRAGDEVIARYKDGKW
jgi:hypothetical protein